MVEHDAWFWHGLVYASCLESYEGISRCRRNFVRLYRLRKFVKFEVADHYKVAKKLYHLLSEYVIIEIMVDTFALPSVPISNRGRCLHPVQRDWVSRALILDH